MEKQKIFFVYLFTRITIIINNQLSLNDTKKILLLDVFKTQITNLKKYQIQNNKMYNMPDWFKIIECFQNLFSQI